MEKEQDLGISTQAWGWKLYQAGFSSKKNKIKSNLLIRIISLLGSELTVLTGRYSMAVCSFSVVG